MRRLLTVAAVVGSMALGSGCTLVDQQADPAPSARPQHSRSTKPRPAPTRSPSAPTPTPSDSASSTPSDASLLAQIDAVSGAQVATATSELTQLASISRHPDVAPYEREAFGESWTDTDGNGCNQRDDVLLRDSIPGTTTVGQQDSCDHDVLAGQWLDPYTGTLLTFDDLKDLSQAQAIQIDHIVPLGEAWASGAAGWSSERRLRFANDLSELLAVDGPTNISKSDDDPAAWRPTKSFQCRYAVDWIGVKYRWQLAADASEKRALTKLLATCPTSG